MNTTNGIVTLKQHILEEDWSWTFAALRRDINVWKALSNPEFKDIAIKKIGKQGKAWSPGRLALLAIFKNGVTISTEVDTHSNLPTPEELQATPLKPLNSQLKQAALQAYDELCGLDEFSKISFTDPTEALGHAGLLALSLRERYRLTGTWSGIADELPKIPQFSWNTTTGCLFGFVPNVYSLLKSLPIDYALHAIFTNPLTPPESIDILDKLQNYYPTKDLPNLLDRISNFDPDIVKPLSNRIIESQLSRKLESDINDDQMSDRQMDDRHTHNRIQMILDDLQSTYSKFGIYQKSKQADQAIPLLGSSLEASHLLVQELTYFHAIKSAEFKDVKEAKTLWNRYINLNKQASNDQRAILALRLFEKGFKKEAKSILSESLSNSSEKGSPTQNLVKAEIALEDHNWEQATESALRGYRIMENADFEDVQFIKSLVTILNRLDLHDESIHAAKFGLELNPNDVDLLTLLADSQMSVDQLDESTQNAHLAIALAPHRIELHRNLAMIYENTKNWQAALEVREKIVNLVHNMPEESADNGDHSPDIMDGQNTLLQEDYRLFAQCALKAEQPEKAIEICNKALQNDSEDGLTHALMGEAHLTIGTSKAAYEYFEKATKLTPHMAEPWLALAKAEGRQGGIKKAIETLKTATQSTPENPKIFLALGKAYYNENSPTEALTAFRRAAELFIQSDLESKDVLNAEIALNLGTTLYDLGHYDESVQVLESAYTDHPKNPSLSYAYAKTLLALNQPELAIAPLSTTMSAKTQEAGPYLDYAGALLKIGREAHKAVEAIEYALEIAPDHIVAKALLAEALYANGDLDTAVTAYRGALETGLKEDPKWGPRLCLGLGRTNLELEQSDVAIATIQQGLQIDPDHLELTYTLVEAYQAAELNDEALQAAKTALDKANDDINNLIWFSEKAVEFGDPQAAIKTLNNAKELAPHRVDLLIRIGEIYQQMRHLDKAKNAFHEVIAKNNSSIPDLRLTSNYLLGMQDYPKAITSLKRAIELTKSESKVDDELLSDLWTELAEIYHQANESEDELHALDQAISHCPDNTDIYALKADLLIGLERSQAALECLEKAIYVSKDHPGLHYRIAHVQRDLGNLNSALFHAEQALNLVDEGTQTAEITAFRGCTAGLTNVLLQESKTRKYLKLENLNIREINDQEDEKISYGNFSGNSIYQSMLEKDQIGYHCLRVEYYLDNEEDILAADALTSAVKINADHPRVMALRSRLSIRHGDLETANQVLKTAMQTLGVGFERPIEVCENVEDLISLADAMMDQLHWNGAVYLLGQAKNIRIQEPRWHYKHAQALVVRAEAQRLYQRLKVIEHAPGKSALAESAYRSFEGTTRKLRSLIENGSESSNQTPQKAESILEKINVLNTRGKAVFEPSDKHCQALGELNQNPEIRAAFIASLIHQNDHDAAAQVAKEHLDSDDKSFHTYPPFLVQASIALAKNHPKIALRAIQDAVRAVTRNSSPDQPIYYALNSDILTITKDYPSALEPLANAVSQWDDEPRWQALIAELYISQSKLGEQADLKAAISHLEKATQLESDYAFHHIALGEAYLRDRNPYAANEAFEQAKQLASHQPNVWLALAQAYWIARDDDRAVLYARRAADLAPDLFAPRLLLSKIAIQTGNPNKARQEAEGVLQLDPQNTEGHIILVQALMALDHPLQALNIIETAIQIAPGVVELELERICILQQVQGAEFALKELDKVIEKYPTDDRILTVQAEILAECGHTEEALQIAREALNLLSVNGIIPKRISKVHNLLGTLQRRIGQLDKAVHHLNEAIDIYPEWTDPYLELGQTYQDRRQQDQALLSYKKAIEVSPRDPRPYYRSGLILKDAKDYIQAEAMLRRAADLAPNDLNIHRQLGAMVALNIVHNRNQDSQVDNLG